MAVLTMVAILCGQVDHVRWITRMRLHQLIIQQVLVMGFRTIHTMNHTCSIHGHEPKLQHSQHQHEACHKVRIMLIHYRHVLISLPFLRHDCSKRIN